jgi:hypothetical protein
VPPESALTSAVVALGQAREGAALHAAGGGLRKEGYLRKLSALKRVAPSSSAGGSPAQLAPHFQTPQVPPKAPRAQLPPVLEPEGDARQEEVPTQLRYHQVRPVSEPAPAWAVEGEKEAAVGSWPRRVSDMGSPTRVQAPVSVMDGVQLPRSRGARSSGAGGTW